LDDLKWGYLEMDRFTWHQVWQGIKPFYLRLVSSGKMDAVGERKHLAGILNGRDPMRSALAMLGMYFAYLFFDLQIVRAVATEQPSSRLTTRAVATNSIFSSHDRASYARSRCRRRISGSRRCTVSLSSACNRVPLPM
jgi:hypothetical protein